MAVILGNDVAKEFLQALNLPTERVAGVDLCIRAGEPVRIRLSQFVDGSEMAGVTQAVWKWQGQPKVVTTFTLDIPEPESDSAPLESPAPKRSLWDRLLGWGW